MSDFLNQWFQGFEEGINNLDQKEKDKFFSKCGRNCAETGVIEVYEKLYLESGNDMNVFFLRLKELECIAGYIIDPGKIYEITFPRCLCDLHTRGYINSDSICECSKHSILYVMKTLDPEHDFQVDKISTVLGGDKECRFRITLD
jgi:hypothetical protein